MMKIHMKSLLLATLIVSAAPPPPAPAQAPVTKDTIDVRLAGKAKEIRVRLAAAEGLALVPEETLKAPLGSLWKGDHYEFSTQKEKDGEIQHLKAMITEWPSLAKGLRATC